MTIQQTIDIPANREVDIHLVVPKTVPCGKQNVILDFPTDPKVRKPVIPGEDDEDGLNLHPTAEQIAAARGPVGKEPFRPSYASLEEVLAAAARRAEAAEADPSLNSLKAFHGIWKDSKAWGQDVDVEAEIRKMRDEWPDYWGVKNGNPRCCRCGYRCRLRRNVPFQR
jgi:hypothetical protein